MKFMMYGFMPYEITKNDLCKFSNLIYETTMIDPGSSAILEIDPDTMIGDISVMTDSLAEIDIPGAMNQSIIERLKKRYPGTKFNLWVEFDGDFIDQNSLNRPFMYIKLPDDLYQNTWDFIEEIYGIELSDSQISLISKIRSGGNILSVAFVDRGTKDHPIIRIYFSYDKNINDRYLWQSRESMIEMIPSDYNKFFKSNPDLVPRYHIDLPIFGDKVCLERIGVDLIVNPSKSYSIGEELIKTIRSIESSRIERDEEKSLFDFICNWPKSIFSYKSISYQAISHLKFQFESGKLSKTKIYLSRREGINR